jgi:pimeloyl-ACP methyl ester carboxylesterase
MRIRTVDGVLIAGRLTGESTANTRRAPEIVVLGHGFTGAASRPAVSRITARLARRSAVLALDFRGHGESAGLSTVGDAEVLDLDAAVGWARAAGYGRVVTVGFSMGGSAVLRHAAGAGATSGLAPRHQVDAVVSVSAASRWYARDTVPMRRVHWLCETRAGRALTAAAFGTRLASGWPELPESPVEVVGRIAPTPLLLVHGDQDSYFPAAHLAALAAAAGPGAERWLVPGYGHAEIAATPALVDRIGAWALAAGRAAGTVPARSVAGAAGGAAPVAGGGVASAATGGSGAGTMPA